MVGFDFLSYSKSIPGIKYDEDTMYAMGNWHEIPTYPGVLALFSSKPSFMGTTK